MTETRCMRFCPPFKINSIVVGEAMDAADEFLIRYSPSRNPLDKLLEFLNAYQEKRVNIYWIDGLDVREAILISKVAKNAVHRINGMSDLSRTAQLIDAGIPFYFNEDFAAKNWLQLEVYAALGVTDVFIADDLTFQLPEVRDFCDKHNIKMRLILDKVMSSMFLSEKVPIYFPQNMDFLSIYYDIGEFATEDEHKLKVLYKVWFRDKRWLGNIQEINPEVAFDFPAQGVLKRFVKFRSNCHQRCLKGSKCNECRQAVDIARQLANMNVRLE